MNLNLSSVLKSCCPTPAVEALKPLQVAQQPLAGLGKPDLGPVFDGGQLPGGCFACGLAFSGQFGEQFLGQFFGL